MKPQYDKQWGSRLKGFLLVFILLISISGCGEYEYQNPSPMPTQKWLADFFSNPTCEPPCWENIIPGETTMEEAQRMVQSRDDIIKFRGPIIPPPVGKDIDFTWTFKNDQRGGGVSSDANGKIVAGITLQINLSLSQIIDKFGFPDQVFPQSTESTLQAGLYLLYPQINMILVTLMGEKDGVIQITPQTYIFSIVMGTDDWQMQSLQRFEDYKNRISSWHGYGEYTVPD